MGELNEKVLKKEITEQYTEDQLAEKWRPSNTNSQNLTMDKLKSFMPKGSSVKITEEILAKIHSVEADTGMSQELFEEQLCSYTHLLGPGISFEKLMNAIKFVTLREVCGNQANAYRIVFPEMADKKEGEGKSIDSFASMYSQTKAVTEIVKLQLLGASITHRPLANQMLQKMLDLANGKGAGVDDYVSPTVQLNAATALYEAVKMPEENSMELKIGMTDDAMESQQNLADQLKAMASVQRDNFKSGRTLNEVQRLNIVHDVEIAE